MKKLLHRHHDHDQDGSPATDASTRRQTAVPASPYASTKAAQAPSTGTYPLHGGVRRHNSLTEKSGLFGLKRRSGRKSWTPSDYTLHLPPQDTDLSRDLGHLTLNDGSPRNSANIPYDEHVANGSADNSRRRLQRSELPPPVPSKDDHYSPTSLGPVTGFQGGFPHRHDTVTSKASIRPVPPTPKDYEDDETAVGPWDGTPVASRQVVSDSESPRRQSISRKPVHSNANVPPLPLRAAKAPELPYRPPQSPVGQTHAAKDASELPPLPIDLSNTVDTTIAERYNPAVTHETVEHKVHHIREERITREIHNHHIFHRILPIIDVEVLPARHFVPARDGSIVEVAESDVPGRVTSGPDGQPRNWFVAETVSKLPEKTTVEEARGRPRQFTARTFEGTEGDFKRWVGEDGVERTETWWVHPPTVEDGGMLTGQTVPIHFGEPYPGEEAGTSVSEDGVVGTAL